MPPSRGSALPPTIPCTHPSYHPLRAPFPSPLAQARLRGSSATEAAHLQLLLDHCSSSMQVCACPCHMPMPRATRHMPCRLLEHCSSRMQDDLRYTDLAPRPARRRSLPPDQGMVDRVPPDQGMVDRVPPDGGGGRPHAWAEWAGGDWLVGIPPACLPARAHVDPLMCMAWAHSRCSPSRRASVHV